MKLPEILEEKYVKEYELTPLFKVDDVYYFADKLGLFMVTYRNGEIKHHDYQLWYILNKAREMLEG